MLVQQMKQRGGIVQGSLNLRLRAQPSANQAKRRRRGLQSPSIAVLCRDGIHLNAAGNYALYRSYRGAILFALKKLATFSEAQ